jgi:hypothetical protein
MSNSQQFKLRISPEDRQLLAAVAVHLQRSQADTLRFLVRDAAHNIGIHRFISDLGSEGVLDNERGHRRGK